MRDKYNNNIYTTQYSSHPSHIHKKESHKKSVKTIIPIIPLNQQFILREKDIKDA